MTRPRVFVLQPCDKPIYTATEFGDITYVFSPTDRPIPHTSREFQTTIIKKLEACNYDPAVDYILLVGSFVPLIVYVAVVCEQYLLPLSLAFDVKSNRYYPISLGIGELNEDGSNQPLPANS